MKFLVLIFLLISCAPDSVPEKVNKKNFEASISNKKETDIRVLIQANEKSIASEKLKEEYTLYSSDYWGQIIIDYLVENEQGSDSLKNFKNLLIQLEKREDFVEIVNFINNESNMSPLYTASSNQNLVNIKLLLSMGATINNQNNNKENPLVVLANNGNIEGLSLFKKEELLKYRSILIENCKTNNQEVVRYLQDL